MKQNELKDTRSGFGAGLLELGKKPKSYSDISGQFTGLIKITHTKIT